MRQSTGKLGLTWPPPQADEEQRQLPEVEDFLFVSFKIGIICVLHSYLLREEMCTVYLSYTSVGSIVAKDLGW